MRYKVDKIYDDPEPLQARLDAICEDGGEVVSVMWQPGCSTHFGETIFTPSFYVVVSGYAADRRPEIAGRGWAERASA